MKLSDGSKKGPGVKCLCPDGIARRARTYPNGKARVTIRRDDGMSVAIVGFIKNERFIPWAGGKNARFFERREQNNAL